MHQIIIFTYNFCVQAFSLSQIPDILIFLSKFSRGRDIILLISKSVNR